MTPIMNILLPEKCFSAVRTVWHEAWKSAIILGAASGLLLFVTAPFIAKFLGVEDPDIARIAVMGIRILAFSLPFISLLYLMTSYYLNIEKIRLSVIVTVLYQMVVLIVLSVLLGEVGGIYGVFAAGTVTPVIIWFVLSLYIRKRYGADAWPLMISDEERRYHSYTINLTVCPDDIVQANKKIMEILNREKLDRKIINRLQLLFEEIYMEVYNRNQGREVTGEYEIVLQGDTICLIEMDDGVIFEISGEYYVFSGQ